MADIQYSDRQRLAETEMTIGELKHLIEQLVQQATGSNIPGSQPNRPVRDILASMRRNVWTPPSGSTSNLELLREDRNR